MKNIDGSWDEKRGHGGHLNRPVPPSDVCLFITSINQLDTSTINPSYVHQLSSQNPMKSHQNHHSSHLNPMTSPLKKITSFNLAILTLIQTSSSPCSSHLPSGNLT